MVEPNNKVSQATSNYFVPHEFLAVYFSVTTFDDVWEKLDEDEVPYDVKNENEDPVIVKQKFPDLKDILGES